MLELRTPGQVQWSQKSYLANPRNSQGQSSTFYVYVSMDAWSQNLNDYRFPGVVHSALCVLLVVYCALCGLADGVSDLQQANYQTVWQRNVANIYVSSNLVRSLLLYCRLFRLLGLLDL